MHNSKDEDARAQGILLHWILSQIKTRADLDMALQKGELKGYYGKNQVPELKQLLATILNHPQLVPFFEKNLKVKNEAELLTAEGEILRPDRLVFTEKETVVIDYKSGKEKAGQHAIQIQEYSRALSALGYGPIRKLLVYLEENKVVELN